MSYLDIPRIHIAGGFFVDCSTVNNDSLYCDPTCENVVRNVIPAQGNAVEAIGHPEFHHGK